MQVKMLWGGGGGGVAGAGAAAACWGQPVDSQRCGWTGAVVPIVTADALSSSHQETWGGAYYL